MEDPMKTGFFTQDFLDFFAELDANNKKEWFDKNRKRYEKSVKIPFKEFVDLMILRVRAEDPAVNIEPKDAIFRINRDIRFSPDKTPYKIHASAFISPEGKSNKSKPGLYFQLNHVDARVYSGVHGLSTQDVYKMREHIANHLDTFQDLINDPEFKKKFGEIKGSKGKRLPPEFREAAEKEPLLFNKEFYFFAKFDPQTVLDPKLPDILMDYYATAKPLKEFLTI